MPILGGIQKASRKIPFIENFTHLSQQNLQLFQIFTRLRHKKWRITLFEVV